MKKIIVCKRNSKKSFYEFIFLFALSACVPTSSKAQDGSPHNDYLNLTKQFMGSYTLVKHISSSKDSKPNPCLSKINLEFRDLAQEIDFSQITYGSENTNSNLLPFILTVPKNLTYVKTSNYPGIGIKSEDSDCLSENRNNVPPLYNYTFSWIYSQQPTTNNPSSITNIETIQNCKIPNKTKITNQTLTLSSLQTDNSPTLRYFILENTSECKKNSTPCNDNTMSDVCLYKKTTELRKKK
ncbi:MAG: hypothetical protein K1X29_02985 [Bdellovibrionales bacterium]|nr:hypothetical protein [Bdellovibrionales bacterium]